MLKAHTTRHILRLPKPPQFHRPMVINPISQPHQILKMSTQQQQKYKLVFFSPPQSLPAVKTAIFAAGAGKIGNYTECCFTTPGIGQFRPNAEANPAIGQRGQVEEVGEVRCETVCEGEEVLRGAIAGLRKSHPYEEPAYDVYKLENF